MLSLPPLIELLFLAAGWNGNRPTLSGESNAATADDIASLILANFSGLKVGECAPGTELAASDVCFYRAPRPDVSDALESWSQSVGKVAAFATAHHDHMILFVNFNGHYFVYTDPDDRLYAAGGDFGELMRRVLWGYEYGLEVAKDA